LTPVADAQSYANHAYRATSWLIAVASALIVTGMLIWDAAVRPSLQSVALVGLALVALMVCGIIRIYAVRLQDRIIRVEMTVRLAQAGLPEAVRRLSVKHIVALRFASDAELRALADRAISESLSPDQIKRAVTDWQADLLRT
jgi:Family of unknown function (DUF6526)